MTRGDGESNRSHSIDDILLLMRPGRDRELLAEWLSAFPRYRVNIGESVPPNTETYDLYLLDPASWEAYRSELRTRQEAVDPVFLPYVLVAPEDDAEVLARGDGDPESGPDSVLDDVVGLPIGQDALHRRLENLLQARRASVRLREREEQYEQLVELTPETILLISGERIVYANAAAGKLLDVGDAADLKDRSMLEFADVDETDALQEVLDTVSRQGRVDGFVDVTLRTEDGRRLPTEVAGVTVTFEGEQVAQLIVRDLTEVKRRQERLDLFGRAVETARQGITIADARQPDFPLIYVNRAFEDITGYSTAEIIGLNCRFLQGDRTNPTTVAKIRAALEDQRAVAVEILNYRKDGTPFWNQLEIVPVTDADGEVTHFLGLQRDVTERKDREERLNVLDRVLRHNLRNRLNVIRGYAEQLVAASEDTDGAAARIIDAAEDLMALSDQVRQYRSLITAGRSGSEEYDIGGRLEATLAALRDANPAATISADFPGTVTARAHETFLPATEQFLELAADTETNCDLSLAVWEESGRAVIEIVDRGGTIPTFELQVLNEEAETPLEHPMGLEAWLLRWATLLSGGDLVVDPDASEPVIRIRLPSGSPEPRQDPGEADGG